jgi:hypothetical protein
MVLEIAIPGVAGGAFQDIITAGGSFVTGGYNRTLNTGNSNPLPGRQAWSGLSDGTATAPKYIDTAVNLPAAAAGRTIALRWSVGSDASQVATGQNGVRIDSVRVVEPLCAPIPTYLGSRKQHGSPGPLLDVLLPLLGTPAIEPRRGAGTNFDQHQVVAVFANPVTVGGISVTSSNGAATATVTPISNTVIINISGAANAQTITLNLSNVTEGTKSGAISTHSVSCVVIRPRIAS